MKTLSPLAHLCLAGTVLAAATIVGCKQLADAASKAGADSQTVGLLQAGSKFEEMNVDAGKRESIGQSVAVSLTSQKGLDSDDALQEYVNLVGLTVAAASEKPDLVYTFGVLDSDDLNAFSAPGGYVLITKGALRMMRDESELAGVLAHEIGHVCKDHSIKAIQGSKFYDGVVTGAAALSKPGAEEQLVKSLGESSKLVIGRNFSQKEEYEADAEAIKTLKNAGYDPNGLGRFLARMPVSKEALPTHPHGPERIAKLNALAGANSTGQTLADRYAMNVKVN